MCVYLFFSRGAQGEGVCVLEVIFVRGNNGGMGPISRISFGMYIVYMYIRKGLTYSVLNSFLLR